MKCGAGNSTWNSLSCKDHRTSKSALYELNVELEITAEVALLKLQCFVEMVHEGIYGTVCTNCANGHYGEKTISKEA